MYIQFYYQVPRIALNYIFRYGCKKNAGKDKQDREMANHGLKITDGDNQLHWKV
tara:strand:- start:295 stop:456 length:162 start_codon:yes stop_codon:yes gene_type:complete